MNFQKNIGVNQEFLIVVLKNKQVKSSVVGLANNQGNSQGQSLALCQEWGWKKFDNLKRF